jgi:hypothetical protein
MGGAQKLTESMCADDDEAFVCALDNIGDFPAVEVWRGIGPKLAFRE